MKYFLLIIIFFLSACNLDKKLVNLNKDLFSKSLKKTKTLSGTLKDEDFKKMTFNEFNLFLEDYSKNSDYPDINN
jgi:hypothetical protein